jgi:signal transduction histidine kinase/DNA-binding response OmpR family regulator
MTEAAGPVDSASTTDAALTQSRAHAPRRWLIAVVGVLALALLGVGYVQWRQFQLLDTASHFQNDALGWSFSQLETEHLRLRNQLQLYMADPQGGEAEKVQMRYDIFVSRIGLVDHERAAVIMREQPTYAPAMAQVHAFVKVADHYLGESPERPLDAKAGQELTVQLEALNAPLHDLSLGASHLLYQRATERNNAVRQQSELGIALTVFQCMLLIALAFIVLRQLRVMADRRSSLEALADNLSAARRDAEAANRAKSAFLANMSHEIRTPFHGMLGMMSLLQEGGLSPQQAAYLDTARESARHLLTILNDILDISQLESGRLQVVPQTVDLPQLITQVDALMRVQALAKGLELLVDLAPDVPRWVRADPTRVKQILFNLLSNAVKFTHKGTIILRVETAAHGKLDFTVTDSGIGMDEPTTRRLFQRFMQGDVSPSRSASGAGLGLEISRDLARLMGGDITVQSKPGVGSSFVASLPLTSVGAPILPSIDVTEPDPASVKPLRVLVAEDHPVNRAYLEAVLEKLGHSALFVLDGDGAVRAVRGQPAGEEIDIVLMDLHMPGMDGFTAARAIRALPAPRGKVPIVALTADAFQASRHLAREAGMDGFLTKPAHLPQLREALQRYGVARVAATPGTSTTSATSATSATIVVPPIAGDTSSERQRVDSNESLLDATTMADLRQALSAERFHELLGGFLNERTRAIDELRLAVADTARGDLRNRAHALKGASLSLGLRRVGSVAEELQSSAHNGSAAELGRLIDRLELQFDASHEECIRAGMLTANSVIDLELPSASDFDITSPQAQSSAAPAVKPPEAPARA